MLTAMARLLRDQAVVHHRDLSAWKLVKVAVPKQGNGYDCGLHIIHFMRKISAAYRGDGIVNITKVRCTWCQWTTKNAMATTTHAVTLEPLSPSTALHLDTPLGA